MAEPGAPNRLAATAVAGVALVQLALHGTLLARGTELVVSALTIDDTYYYLGTAWNLKRLGFPSFDGIHPTNGVQFLWFWVLAALAWLVPTKTAFLQAALAAGALANAACHAAIWRFARLLGRPQLALWMAGLWLLQSLGSVAYSRGLENSLHALVFWGVAWQGTLFLAEVRAGRRPRFGVLTALLVLNAWSRIDAGLLSLVVYGACAAGAWRAAPAGPERRHVVRRVGATAAAAGAAGLFQLAVFRWMGGSWFPVSALVKAGLEVESWTGAALRAARLGLPAVVPPVAAFAALGLYWLLVGRRGARVRSPAGSATKGAPPDEGDGRRPSAGDPLRSWNRLWLVLLAGILIHAALLRGGSYWYQAPSHVFWNVTLALLAYGVVARLCAAGSRPGSSPWPGRVAGRSVRRLATAAPVLFLAGAVALTGLLVASRGRMEPNFYALRARVGRWISQNLPPDAVLASWNAGQLGYFSDQPVINLDGLANSAEYHRRVLRGSVPMEEYLAAEGVDYVVDRSDGSRLLELYGGHVLDGYPVVRRFVLREDEPRVLLWRVVPPAR